MSRSNNTGQNYAKLSNAWNNNEFMKKYNQVNNPYFPFVFGNPDGYATNTNPQPFNWGDPNVTKYCACGASLQLQQGIDHINAPASRESTQGTREGLCSQCASSASAVYKERDATTNLVQDLDLEDVRRQNVHKEVDDLVPIDDEEPADVSINDWGGVAKQTAQQNLTLLNSYCAANPSSELCSIEGFGARQGYTEDYGAAQQPDINSFIQDTTEDKFYDQQYRDAGNPLEHQSFCQATNGGKKLAF